MGLLHFVITSVSTMAAFTYKQYTMHTILLETEADILQHKHTHQHQFCFSSFHHCLRVLVSEQKRANTIEKAPEIH